MGTNSLNLVGLKPGDVVRMTDGSRVRITHNPGDGVWVFGCALPERDDAVDAGAEQPIFAQDIDELLSSDGKLDR